MPTGLRSFQWSFLGGFAALLLATGCQRETEPVRQYNVKLNSPRGAGGEADKTQDLPADHPPINGSAAGPAMAAPGGGSMLAVLIQQDDKAAWSLKVSGSQKTLEAFAAPLQEFVKTIKLGDNRPEWKLPEGWTEVPGSGLRFATLKVANPNLEIAVNQFTVTPSFLADNINRWRGQVGLEALPEGEVAKSVESLKLADGTAASFAKLFGAEKPAAANTPPATPAPASGPSIMLGALIELEGASAWSFKSTGPVATMEKFAADFTAFVKTVKFTDGKPEMKMPEGWSLKPATGFRYATITAKVGDSTAEVAVNQFTVSADFLGANVNRWRDQMSLPPLEGDAVTNSLEKVKLADGTTAYIAQIKGQSKGGGMMAPFAPK